MTDLFVTSRKFFYKLRNGENYLENTGEFSTHLKANNIEEVRADLRLELSWSADASGTRFIDFNGNKIESAQGSFVKDGLSVGDVVDVWNGGVLVSAGHNITALSASRIDIDGAALPAVSQSQDARIRATNEVDALVYQYGLIANNGETTNFFSKIDGSVQEFQVSGLGAHLPVPMIPSGIIQGWRSGSVTVQFVGQLDAYTRTYYLVHTDFVVLPTYLEGYEADLAAGLLTQLYQGADSIKYVSRYDFRNILSNANTGKIGIDDQDVGNVGGFDEVYNGQPTPFTLNSITYEDTLGNPVTSLRAKQRTRVNMYIDTSTVDTADIDRLRIYHHKCPLQTEYENQTDEFRTVWIYDSIHADDFSITLGAPIDQAAFIKEDASTLRVIFEVEFNTAQQNLISDQGNFILSVSAENSNVNIDSSQKTSVLVFGQYTKDNDVSGLLEYFDLVTGFLNHPAAAVSVLASLPPQIPNDWWSNFNQWNEDGILYENTWFMDINNRFIMKTVNVHVVAYNSTTGHLFELETIPIDLNSQVVYDDGVGVTQNVTLMSTRSFNLAVGDKFNLVRLLSLSTMFPEIIHYRLSVGLKVRWEEWIALPNADAVFYDPAQENNGLNLKSSNYSLKHGYDLRVLTDVELENFDDKAQATTIYRRRTPESIAYDYDLDSHNPTLYVADIKTFAPDNTDLGGKILEGEDTRIEITYEDTSAPIVNALLYYGINRIEEKDMLGQQIYELSTLLDPPANNWLKPLAGDILSRITLVGGKMVVESLIDHTKINKNLLYSLSGRLGSMLLPTQPAAKITEGGLDKATETDDLKITEK